MVFFKDKQGIPHTLEKPIDFLSERAIQRRLNQNISITDTDLPVNRSYVETVRDAGAAVFYTTRWMNGVLVACESSAIPAIEALPHVDRVEYVAPGVMSTGGRTSFKLRKHSQVGSATAAQIKMLGLDQMHSEGYTGKGVVVAVLDSGFPGVEQAPAFTHIFSDGRFDAGASFDFVHNQADVFHADDHGTEVLSVMAGIIPDAFTGGAYGATFQLFVTEDVPTEYRVEEYNWLFAAERADSAGADIIHSSLGYYDFDDASMNYSTSQMDGKTTVVTRAAQWAAERGIVVVTSAGNEGNIPTWRIITAPADAEGTLAIGSVNKTGQRISSSSIGPTADGRIKPDLMALGMGVTVVKSGGQIGSASGTSLAAPLVTSLVAGVLQRYPGLSSKTVVNLLKQSASQAGNPDNLLGFGIPHFQAIVDQQDEVPQKGAFEVFPNPVWDTLTVRPRDPRRFESCQIELISSQGRVLASAYVRFDWINRTYHANLSGLATGTYFIRVHSTRGRDTFRVVKL